MRGEHSQSDMEERLALEPLPTRRELMQAHAQAIGGTAHGEILKRLSPAERRIAYGLAAVAIMGMVLIADELLSNLLDDAVYVIEPDPLP